MKECAGHKGQSPVPLYRKLICYQSSHSPAKKFKNVQELVREVVLEVQMAGSRTSVLELVQEVKIASSRTSVLQELNSSRTEVLEPAICTSPTSS